MLKNLKEYDYSTLAILIGILSTAFFTLVIIY